MINPPKHQEHYVEAIFDCMLEVGWTRGEIL
jgi:hypothetical protein